MSSAEVFYPVTPKHPPANIRVIVRWRAREFQASRVMHPHTRRWVWATSHEGNLEFLPPPRQAERWGENPDAWRPLKPEAWKMPLPRPYTSCEPRMWHATQSFNAAEAAAEMEADRAAAWSDGEAEPAKRGLWWLVARIEYKPPGQVTRKMAAARVLRALASDTLANIFEGVAFDRGGMDYETLRDLAELKGHELEAVVERFMPDRGDLDDYSTAMAWFAALAGADGALEAAGQAYGRRRIAQVTPAQQVLFLASRPQGLSFEQIGAAFANGPRRRPISRQRVHVIYRNTLEAVWEIANGFENAGSKARQSALTKLKIGNRQAAAMRGIG